MLDAEFAALRRQMGLSQEQLGQALGVAANTVARWERGERGIPPYLQLAMKQLVAEAEREQRA